MFSGLAKAVAEVKRLAPGKLAYINLFPNYATLGAPDLSQLETPTYHEYLERFVSEVKPQFISYDNYQVQFSDDLKTPRGAGLYFTNLLEVRNVAQEHDLPFWNIVSSNQIRPRTVVPSPANLLFQAYTTLAAGGRGLTWYTYYDRGYHDAPIDDVAHSRTVSWSYLKMVNEQVKTLGPRMVRLKSTGVYFTAPPPANGLPALPGKIVSAVTCESPIMVGEFSGEDGSGDAVMVVNLSLERSAKLDLNLADKTHKPQLVSPVDGSLAPLPADHPLWLAAGQGALIVLR